MDSDKVMMPSVKIFALHDTFFPPYLHPKYEQPHPHLKFHTSTVHPDDISNNTI